jgi:hypothetical protein
MNYKKIIYLLMTMLLFVLLMSMVHSLLDFWYFHTFLASDATPEISQFWIFSTSLPVYIPFLLLLAGLAAGFFTGLRWWQWVYVEKRHWSFQNKKKKRK